MRIIVNFEGNFVNNPWDFHFLSSSTHFLDFLQSDSTFGSQQYQSEPLLPHFCSDYLHLMRSCFGDLWLNLPGLCAHPRIQDSVLSVGELPLHVQKPVLCQIYASSAHNVDHLRAYSNQDGQNLHHFDFRFPISASMVQISSNCHHTNHLRI